MEKIHRRIVASEVDCSWHNCIQCGWRFEPNEILTAVDVGGNNPIVYWVCEQCMERYFGDLLRQGWRKTWRIRKKDGSREEIDWNGAA